MAALKTPYNNFENMVALSSICHLLPQKMPVADLYSSDKREFLQQVGVVFQDDWIPSNHAVTWIRKKTPNWQHPTGLSFNFFYGNSRALLGGFAYLCKNQHEHGNMQHAIATMLERMCRGTYDLLPGIPIENSVAAVGVVLTLLEDSVDVLKTARCA